ncbi:MAG TPA: hypothetical protein VN643_17645 [Pyrinomonadaceae bacterium]|nr:hypothetical protein [Pyrinomonadaceae bacterium]
MKKLSIMDFSRRAQATRLLSLALLVLVAYSTTFEAVHTHKNLLRSTPAATTASINDSNAPSQTRAQNPAGECLACQFQQNLSNAELLAPPTINGPAVFHAVAVSAPLSINSLSQRTGYGRAPPVTS